MNTPAPWPLLALFLALIAVERGLELERSARHARTLRALGAIEHGRRHFPLFVALHATWPLALVAEVLWLEARPWPGWPLALGVFALAQLLRLWAIRSLGTFWNVRVWVLPGTEPVARGPYRWIRHPNYLAVAVELASGPLMFGAWRTALAASLVNAIAMAVRIPVEERALREAAPAAATRSAGADDLGHRVLQRR